MLAEYKDLEFSSAIYIAKSQDLEFSSELAQKTA